MKKKSTFYIYKIFDNNSNCLKKKVNKIYTYIIQPMLKTTSLVYRYFKYIHTTIIQLPTE